MKRLKGSAIFLTVCILFCLPFLLGCKSLPSEEDEYEVSAEYFDNGLISVDLTINYHVKHRERTAYFNIFAENDNTSDDKNTAADCSLGKLNVARVTVFDKAAGYDFSNRTLSVEIGDKKRVRVNIKYAITLNECAKANSINLSGFIFTSAPYNDGRFLTYLPTKYGNDFSSDAGDYTIKLTIPSTYFPIASAKAVACDLSSNKTLYSYKIKSARNFGVIISDKFNVNQKKWGNRSVIQCFFDNSGDLNTMDFVIKCLNFYENFFGGYPYDSFAVVSAPDFYNGYVFPCIAIVADKKNKTDKEDFYYALAKKIAGQWWRCIIEFDGLNGYCIEEGLSVYSAYLFFDCYKEYGVSSKDLLSDANKLLGDNGVKLPTKPLNLIQDEREYELFANRLFSLLCETERVNGRNKVISFLQNFYREHKFERVGKRDSDFITVK